MNGKQLKNSILQWAIQGKLVPQDPNDEPASVLLERIRAEKARLVKEGKIKKDKNESIIFRGDDNSHYEKFLTTGEVKCIDEEIPFEIPDGWEWTRLRNIVFSHGQRVPSAKFSYIDIGSIDNKNQCLNTSENIIEPQNAPSRARRIVESGDILYSTVRPYLHNMCIVDKQFSYTPIASTGLAVLACHTGVCNRFLFIYLQSPQFDLYANDGDNAKGVAYPAINDEKLYAAFVPVPPFSEQQRIISKIQNLKFPVDRYRKSQEWLDQLNNNISALLKKSILQEAIQGKLVPQDPSDEPASELLRRIREEKLRLVKEGKLKKKDITDSVIFKGDDNRHYEKIDSEMDEIDIELAFPKSWQIVRLGDVCRLIDGEKKSENYPSLDAKFLRGKTTATMLNAGKYVGIGSNIILVDGENSGEVFSVPMEGYMGSTFKQLWISSEMYVPYVLNFIRYYKDQLRNSKKGAAIPHLNKDIFYNLVIGIPPFDEQKRISQRVACLLDMLP